MICFGVLNHRKYLYALLLFAYGCTSPQNQKNESVETHFNQRMKAQLDTIERGLDLSKTVSIDSALQCPCCDYFTLNNRGDFEICAVCFWEDDGIDINQPDMFSTPNHMTLRVGRHNFQTFGACDSSFISNVISEIKRKHLKIENRQIL